MFTNEFEFDETVTTIIDEEGIYEDVSIFINDDNVFIRQWNPYLNRYETTTMSHMMWLEIQKAMQTEEGMFRLELE